MIATPSAFRVAIASHDAGLRARLRNLLTRLGHKVSVKAETGWRLAQLCRPDRPDLIVSDSRLPDMTGKEAAARVGDGVPVVLLASGPDLPRAREGPGLTYVVKPVSQAALQVAIRVAEARSLARQETAAAAQPGEDRTSPYGA